MSLPIYTILLFILPCLPLCGFHDFGMGCFFRDGTCVCPCRHGCCVARLPFPHYPLPRYTLPACRAFLRLALTTATPNDLPCFPSLLPCRATSLTFFTICIFPTLCLYICAPPVTHTCHLLLPPDTCITSFLYLPHALILAYFQATLHGFGTACLYRCVLHACACVRAFYHSLLSLHCLLFTELELFGQLDSWDRTWFNATGSRRKHGHGRTPAHLVGGCLYHICISPTSTCVVYCGRFWLGHGLGRTNTTMWLQSSECPRT